MCDEEIVRRSREPTTTNIGVLENWFARDEEAMFTFMHEMSRKQINIPKVLDFS